MRRIVAAPYLMAGMFFMLFAGGAQGQDIEAGKALAQKHCASCHAITETGNSPHDEAPPFREVVMRYKVENLAEAFAEGITVGHQAMPEFILTPEQIDDLLSYLNSLKQ